MLELNVNDLLEYTEWQRQKWYEWFREHSEALKISAGTHGDGRLDTIGDVIRHVFSAEKRYVERLLGRPLTDATAVPSDNVEALFQFGETSRRELREFLAQYKDWDLPQEMKILDYSLKITARKIIVHVVMHEIRHWAQIATLVRLNGMSAEGQDFLFSPVFGGEIKRGQANA